MSNFLTAAATAAAKVYKRYPFRPLNRLLAKLYFAALNVGNGGSIVQKRVNGINFELDLREVIDSQMFYVGSREPSTSKTLEFLCLPGSIAIDIGANIGSHTLPMAKLVGPEGRVYAFEPVPWALRKLHKNIDLNEFENITVEAIALGDTIQSSVPVKFRASFKIAASQGVGPNGEVNSEWFDECEEIDISISTLDEYVQANDIRAIGLIKLDVDGFEGKVIRGALNTLNRFHPVLIMEVAPAWLEMRGDSAVKICNMLADLGYRCFTEVTFDEIVDVERMVTSIPSGGGMNVVFARLDPKSRSSSLGFA